MTSEEQRVLDLLLTEVRGIRTDTTAHGLAIARIEERLNNAVEDIKDGRTERSTLREKVYQFGIWAAGIAYVVFDNRSRFGQ